MKFLLFAQNASYAHASLSVRVLRDALLRAGYECEIAEATTGERSHEILARLCRANADVYGFSAYIWNIDEMLSLAKDLKTLRPAAKIVFGGPEVSFATERFHALSFIDCVIAGEGEEAIVRLAEILAAGENLPPFICGTPDRDFTRAGIYYQKEEKPYRLVYYESSRGCPFSCSFCLSSAGEGVRAKSAEVTLSDLLAFEEFPEPLTVKLVDRTFNFDRERAKAIWQGLLDPAYTKCYHFEIAAHLLDDESFDVLSRFPRGKIRLEIGLQSTNEKTLAAVARHADPQVVLDAARRLTAAGNLHVHLDLIAGLPHEDLASFARSFDEAYFACDVLQLGFLKLLHGTKLRAEAEQYGILYSERAPYTVLQTRDISFAELERLHAVDELTERLRDGGKFLHTLEFLLPRHFTPFAFYDGFAAYLARETGKSIQKISQRDLFTHLARFAGEKLNDDEKDALGACLRADFAAFEVRRAPRF